MIFKENLEKLEKLEKHNRLFAGLRKRIKFAGQKGSYN